MSEIKKDILAIAVLVCALFTAISTGVLVGKVHNQMLLAVVNGFMVMFGGLLLAMIIQDV